MQRLQQIFLPDCSTSSHGSQIPRKTFRIHSVPPCPHLFLYPYPIYVSLSQKQKLTRQSASFLVLQLGFCSTSRSLSSHSCKQPGSQTGKHTFTVQAIPSAPKSSPFSSHIKPFLFISRFTEHPLPSLSISFLLTSTSYSPSLPSAATSISPNI